MTKQEVLKKLDGYKILNIKKYDGEISFTGDIQYAKNIELILDDFCSYYVDYNPVIKTADFRIDHVYTKEELEEIKNSEEELTDEDTEDKTKLIICSKCGAEVEKNVHNQKYCVDCAADIRRSKIKEKTKFKKKLKSMKYIKMYLVDFKCEDWNPNVVVELYNLLQVNDMSWIKTNMIEYYNWAVENIK